MANPLIADPVIQAAYDAWWKALSKRGDPKQRPNLSIDAFVAGWCAAVIKCLDSPDIAEATVRRWR